MARTPQFAAVRRSLRLAAAERARAPRDEVDPGTRASRAASSPGRRAFLARAAAGAGAVVFAGCASVASPRSPRTPREPRVAIVGAGLAGLVCAHRLGRAGVAARVFEASGRAGGRVFTARGAMAEGQHFELGGELIDSGHVTMHALVAELGLALDDLRAFDAGVRADTFFFGGRVVSEAELVRASEPLIPRLAADLAASEADHGVFERLDARSVAEYLDGVDDLDPTLRAVLLQAYVDEYGLEADAQSAFNLLWLLADDAGAARLRGTGVLRASEEPHGAFHVFGESDERFRVRGGNDLVASRLVEGLAEPVALGHRLVRAARSSDGRWRLSFDRSGGATVEAAFERVVLALPWTLLRQVEITPALPEPKATMVRELGYGTTAKLMLQFDRRTWRERHGAGGSTICDTGAQTFWETSRAQAGASGLLTLCLGGDGGLRAGHGAPEEQAHRLLPSIDQVYPDTAASYRAGSAARMHWPTSPFALGGYACYRPGQAAWSGYEGLAVGNLHFCGEHTSEAFQGFMEGAAESGVRVAAEVLAAVG